MFSVVLKYHSIELDRFYKSECYGRGRGRCKNLNNKGPEWLLKLLVAGIRSKNQLQESVAAMVSRVSRIAAGICCRIHCSSCRSTAFESRIKCSVVAHSWLGTEWLVSIKSAGRSADGDHLTENPKWGPPNSFWSTLTGLETVRQHFLPYCVQIWN